MNRAARIKHIENIKNGEAFGKVELPWKDQLTSMYVYQVPLEYLVYNKYNGRILSRTKSLETQGHMIDVESAEGKQLIEKLLWESKEDRNRKTLASLEKYGQEKIGIITKDGIVIDGNRRTMLLNKIPTKGYFKAVVLPVALEDDPLEIEKLETSYQMGEDEKLSYNPVEKYLKVKELMKKLASTCDEDEAIDKITEWMNESTTEIKKYIKIMETMDDYLESLDYQGIYTQLDGREDQFISLTKWLNTFYDTESKKGFDGYSDTDVDDLKNIALDYIRAKHEGKSFRRLADGNREKHLFGNEDVWMKFKEIHFDTIEPILDQEMVIDYDSKDIEAHLNDRDRQFMEKTEIFLDENLNDNYQRIRNQAYKNEPEKLIKRAKVAVEAINPNLVTLLNSDDIQNEVKELSKTIGNLLLRSPLQTLEHICTLLENIDFSKSQEDEEALLEQVAIINKVTFDLKKELGG